MSKGSNRRPAQVDTQTLDNNWQRIFGNKMQYRILDELAEEAQELLMGY